MLFCSYRGSSSQILGALALHDSPGYLEPRCSATRFRQRLVKDQVGTLDDAELLSAPLTLQLILVPFASAGRQEVDELLSAAKHGWSAQAEQILQRPQDPNLTSDEAGSLDLVVAKPL